MKILWSLLFIFCFAFGDPKSDLLDSFKKEEYKSACSTGMKHYAQYMQDEEYITLYAFSCLRADYIDRLAVPISGLKHTPEARANAAYFSVILLQKKLLYHALIDEYDMGTLKLPTTDYVLSKVFDLYMYDPQKAQKSSWEYQDEQEKEKHYKLFIDRESKPKKIVVEVYQEGIMTSRHLYW